MASIVRQNGHTAYGIVHKVVSYEADIADLSTSYKPGSKAYVVSTGNKYILDEDKTWKKMKDTGGGGGGSLPDIATDTEVKAMLVDIFGDILPEDDE